MGWIGMATLLEHQAIEVARAIVARARERAETAADAGERTIGLLEMGMRLFSRSREAIKRSRKRLDSRDELRSSVRPRPR